MGMKPNSLYVHVQNQNHKPCDEQMKPRVLYVVYLLYPTQQDVV